jgi:hypothetical protein
LSKQSGFYEYGVSPFQMRAFAGFFNPGAFLLFKRTTRQVMFLGPPLVVFYSLAKWADSKVSSLLYLILFSSLSFIIAKSICIQNKQWLMEMLIRPLFNKTYHNTIESEAAMLSLKPFLAL